MIAATVARCFLAATLALAAPGAAFAMPHAVATASGAPIETVAMGCGIGRTRDATGRCRHRFNLFDHHDHRHFQTYRQNHCTTVDTPNGRVRRCRI